MLLVVLQLQQMKFVSMVNDLNQNLGFWDEKQNNLFISCYDHCIFTQSRLDPSDLFVFIFMNNYLLQQNMVVFFSWLDCQKMVSFVKYDDKIGLLSLIIYCYTLQYVEFIASYVNIRFGGIFSLMRYYVRG
eukprot:TRINITY_DN10510_c0_g1_i7.p2 TRINITY_DN10510_c0_g1~~TRINITY_DN10510_c0_g1_i7.p2  ORF type:complete len:131 (-),score=5.75 TRINITY_DN10510_c0_g1_i7:59-451(-)